MSQKTMIECFSRLSTEKKICLLFVIGTRLTTYCRELYIEGCDIDVTMKKARGFNEMCHKIFGQLYQNFTNQKGFSDEIFVATLAAIADENDLSKYFLSAWESAREFVERS